MGTNKAEEIQNKIKRLISGYVDMGTYGLVELELRELTNSRQSEIDELTKEVEILEEWNKKYEDNQVENFERVKNQEHKIVELTKEVERLKVLNKRLFTLWESLYSPNKLII